jgi:hypothetical protein
LQFLAAITVKCGSLIVSLEVKIDAYRLINEHNFMLEAVVSGGSYLFRTGVG